MRQKYGILLVGVMLATSGFAETDSSPQDLPSGQAPEMNLIPVSGEGVPAASYVSPNAFGSGYAVFINGNRATYWTGESADGGGLTTGVALGDAHRYVGGTIAVNLTSLSFDNSFISNGASAFRLNRYLDNNTAIAVGMENLYGWGSFKNTAKSYYAAVTHLFPMAMPLTVNAGIGTGAFHDNSDFLNNNDGTLQPFVSIGFGLLHDLSLLADYRADELSLGGVYTFRLFSIPFFANMGIVNVFNNNGNNTNYQCGLGAAYQFAA